MRIQPSVIIQTYLQQEKSVRATSSLLGIHPSTIYRWIIRARSLSQGRLRTHRIYRKSTRPHHPYQATSMETRRAICRLREHYGMGASRIRAVLKLSCGVNTVHRVLKTEGLLRQYGNHRRPYFQQTIHMHLKNTSTIGYLQMDVKYLTPELTGLPWTCFEYGIIDIYSRYKDAVILNHLDQDGAIEALTTIIPRLPFKPVFIQTDNGLEFQGRLTKIAYAQGLAHHHIHKSTPNENAVIERSFRTDEDEFYLYQYKGAKDYDDLRSQYALYLHWYNHERPHLGIQLQTPLQVVAKVLGE